MPNGAPDANEWQKVAAQTPPKITKSGANSIMYGHNFYVEPELVSASHLIRLVYATASKRYDNDFPTPRLEFRDENLGYGLLLFWRLARPR